MHKFVAIYDVPEQPEQFEEAYFGTHLPLIDRVPGVARTEVSRVTRMVRGRHAVHLTAEMYFPDADTLRSALKSTEWAAAGENLADIGGLELATMYIAEAVDRSTEGVAREGGTMEGTS
jgi:uncharacterized protein (TIGR02118 family)